MVESTDNTDQSDYFDLIEDLNHPNKLVQLFALGQIKRTIMQFPQQKELTQTDKLLLKGFYTSKRADLEERLPALQLEQNNLF